MKKLLFTLTLSSAVLWTMPASAHDTALNALGTTAAGSSHRTDVWKVNCPLTATARLSVLVWDQPTAPENTALVSVWARKIGSNSAGPVQSDTISDAFTADPNDTAFSAASNAAGGSGDYLVSVSKPNTATGENYILRYHCLDAGGAEITTNTAALISNQ